MADELQLVTTNAASDGWVDGVPGAVSTGYQAQNTVLQALFNGLDKSSVRISGANLIVDPSGVIDDSGLPFVVQSAITLALPTTGAANWYLKVVAGSTALERSIEFTDDRGTYDAAKNGFYNTGGERILNWVYCRHTGTLHKIGENKEASDIKIGQLLYIKSGTGQTVNTTWTLLTNYAAPTVDNFSAWENTSADTYDIIETNQYRISAIMTNGIGFIDAGVGIAIYIDGVISEYVGRTDGTETNTGAQSIQVYADVHLTAGQNVKIYGYMVSGSGTPSPAFLSIAGDSSFF